MTESGSLLFRETEPADLEGLFSVRARTKENAFSREQLAALGITPESTAKGLASGWLKSCVCSDAAQLVGFCSGDGRTGEILVLAVLPQYEHRGIGTGLLTRIVERLRSVGCKNIWLAASSDAKSRAYGFYRSRGWRPSGDRDERGDEILELSTYN